MRTSFLLGIATGVAATLFFTSEKTKRVIKNITEKYDDKVIEIADSLKEKIGAADSFAQSGIDKVTHKLII